MGLTRIKTRTFWWVSQLGMLPATAAYVYAGSTVPSLRILAVDGAVVSTNRLDANSARIGASAGLGSDFLLLNRLAVTIQGGVGRGLTRDGQLVPWFSIGLPF